MHADVDERAEGGHVADHPFQHHALAQVLDVFHAIGETRRLELGTRIAAGLFQFLQDVAHGGHAESLVGELLGLEPAQEAAVAQQCLDRPLCRGDDALDHRIGLRVHGRGIQRLVAIGDAQEAGALFEGLVAQARHLEQVAAAPERAVLVAMADDVLGHRRRQARHPRQQRGRSGVDEHAHRVDAILHARVQRLGQAELVHVVLVLADTDRLGLDLDQFGQRILQAPRDRYGPAQRHVEAGELAGRELGRRVHRGAGLTDHDLLQLRIVAGLDDLTGELVGFAAGGAVADGDQFDVVPGAQQPERLQRLFPLAPGFVRIDRLGRQQLAGGIDHGDLAAGADARVQPEHGPGTGRCGQQQVLEVVAEHRDGFGLGLLAGLVEQVQQQVHVQLRAPGQAAGVQQPAVRRAALVGDAGAARHPAFGVLVAGVGIAAGVQFKEQDFLAARAEQRQQPVRGNLRQRLGMLEVIAVLGAFGFLAFGDAGTDHPDLAQPLAQLADQRRVLAPAFHQDRARAFQRGLGIGHALVGIDETGGEGLRIPGRVCEQAVGQRFQPGFAGDLRAGAALGLVRQVQVLQPRLGVGSQDLVAQLVAQLALFPDAGEHRGTAVFQFAQVGQAHFQVAQLGVVQAAGDFLAVAGDERNAGAFIEQRDGGLGLCGLGADLVGDGLRDLLRELAVLHGFQGLPLLGKPAFWQRVPGGESH